MLLIKLPGGFKVYAQGWSVALAGVTKMMLGGVLLVSPVGGVQGFNGLFPD